MKKDKKLLFTTGELAALSKISRKTLLFYAKLGLLKPAYIDNNGYRYYARNQFLSLEIILTMRKLNISLADIKIYLENKSSENYLNFLIEQEKTLDILLKSIVKTKMDTIESITLFKKLSTNYYNSPHIQEEKEEIIYLSKEIPVKSTSKMKTKIFAEHFASSTNFINVSNNIFGYILSKKILCANERPRVKYFFRTLSSEHKANIFFSKQAGTYLVLYFKGPYSSKKIIELLPLIKNYIGINNLKLTSDIYVTSIKNYWLTDDEASYINKIAILITKK